MPQLQIVSYPPREAEKAYHNLLRYVSNPEHCQCGLYGMTNVYTGPGMSLAETVDRYYWSLRNFHCLSNGRYALHFIIEFSPNESKHLNPQTVLELSYHFAQRNLPNLVCFFAVHDHSCYKSHPDQVFYHIDMLVLTVDIYTGQIYSCGRPGAYSMLYGFIDTLRGYIPENDITAPIVIFGRTSREPNICS